MIYSRITTLSDHTEKWLRVILVIAGVIVLLGFVSLVSAGSPQISGIGYFDDSGACTDDVTGPEGQSPDFANIMTGDLKGCLYVFVDPDSIRETPSGVYIERGAEIYVGSGDDGDNGTFMTTYLFTAKFDESGQKFGRCQHPIVAGSGTGDYDGVRGRLDFKDSIEGGIAVNFPYTGHLNYSG